MAPRMSDYRDFMKTSIRNVSENDAQAICDIYNHYVTHTTITFEQRIISLPEMRSRIKSTTEIYPWLVAESEQGIVAYAYATRWRSRAAYDLTAESTIYVSNAALRSGVGFPLYTALLERLRQQEIHAVVGCIALPNPGSIALHERCGFQKVAHFPQVGRKFDQWIDVGFWQAHL